MVIKHAKIPESSNLFLKSFKVTKYGINVESALKHIIRRKIPLAPITWIVGDNGIGKSMLLASLYASCGFKLPWWCTHDWDDKIKIIVEKNADQIKKAGKVEAAFMPLSDRMKKGHVDDVLDILLPGQSLGQKIIMMVEPLIKEAKRQKAGVVLIDDIDVGLSMRTQVDFAKRLKKALKNSGLQLIAVTHSPILVETIGGYCLDLDDSATLKPVAGYLDEING